MPKSLANNLHTAAPAVSYPPSAPDGHDQSVSDRACCTFLFADMVAYSKLISRGGDAAIAELDRFRALFADHISGNGGTLVECAGDSIFACFTTPLAAVKAAINIQNALASCNDEREPSQFKVQARIGLHTGEATVRGGAYFGDDVNIAARLEPLAVPGGITVSKPTFDAVRNEIFVPTKWLGPQSLKNIGGKIRVYLLVPGGIHSRVHLHYFLRRQQHRLHTYRYYLLSVALALCAMLVYLISHQLTDSYDVHYLAVAPFANTQQNGAADYLGRGMAEAIRTQLGDMPGLYVVTDDNQVATPLRLEGSIQQVDQHLRIGYRLIRTRDGAQLAGNHLNGHARDILSLQDRLAAEISQAVAKAYDLPARRPAASLLTSDATAYDFYLRGQDALRQPFSHEHTDLAVELFTKALQHDADMTPARVGICRAFLRRHQHAGGIEWLDRAAHHCDEAVATDPASAEAYAARGVTRELSGQWVAAEQDLQQALIFDPGHVNATLALARIYRKQDQGQRANDTYQALAAANPHRWDVLQAYGYHQIKTGAYREAAETFARLTELTPNNMSAHNGLGAAYLYLGEFQRAAAAFERSTAISPDASAVANAGTMYYFLGNYQKAEQLFSQAQELEPDNFVWSANRGDALRQLERPGAATAQYQLTLRLALRTLRRNALDIKALRHAALASQLLDQSTQARHYIDKALQSEPSDLDTLAMHARIACLAGARDTSLTMTQDLVRAGYSQVLLAADPDLRHGCFKANTKM